jgi:predicted dehydrogenase
VRERDCQAVAVCDVDSWRMEEARLKIDEFYANRTDSGSFRGCATYSDWRELLERPEIDAVMIGTPDHWHVLQSVAALRAGKDVACEKPLTRSIAAGRKLCQVVTETERVFRTDSEFRSNLTMFRAVELVRNGKLGKLERMITGFPRDTTLPPQPDMSVPDELDYAMWQGPAPERPYTVRRVHPRHDIKARPGWLTIRDYADGMLANWGAHLNDIAMWGNDTEHTGPVRIEGTGQFPPTSNLWNVILEFDVRFTFANGVELRCKSDRPYVRFEGSEGWVQVGYPKEIECSDEKLLGWRSGTQDLQLTFKSSEKRDFLDAVKSRTQPLYDVEGGHRVNSLSHLALASIELGRPLKWDPEAEKVIGDNDANRLLEPKPLRDVPKQS